MSNPKDQLVQMLLKHIAAAKPPQGNEATVETVEYEWNTPNCFTLEQQKVLGIFASQTARQMSYSLTDMFRGETAVEVAAITQHFAATLRKDADNLDDHYHYIPLMFDDNNEIGLISIAPKSGIELVGKLLGNSKPAESDQKELSALEADLLMDIVEVIVQAFNSTFEPANGKPITFRKSPSKGVYPLGGDETENYCKISFKLVGQEDGDVASFLILTGIMERIARDGDDAGDDARDSSAQMLTHVKNSPITAVAHMASANVSVRDMMELQAGDVILTDKKINEPLELCVRGKRMFLGFPVTCMGQCALRIADQIEKE